LRLRIASEHNERRETNKNKKDPTNKTIQSMAAMVSSSLRVFQSSGNGVTGAGLASSKSAGITGGRSVMVPVSSARGVGAHVGLISLRASKVEVEEEETGVVTGGGVGGVVGVVTTRRLALALVAGVMSSLNSRVAPANAAYGEAGTCVRGGSSVCQ
jgi:hypothetical protein